MLKLFPHLWFVGDNQQQRPGVLSDSAVGLSHPHSEFMPCPPALTIIIFF